MMMAEVFLDEPGPVDYVVVEFPTRQLRPSETESATQASTLPGVGVLGAPVAKTAAVAASAG